MYVCVTCTVYVCTCIYECTYQGPEIIQPLIRLDTLCYNRQKRHVKWCKFIDHAPMLWIHCHAYKGLATLWKVKVLVLFLNLADLCMYNIILQQTPSSIISSGNVINCPCIWFNIVQRSNQLWKLDYGSRTESMNACSIDVPNSLGIHSNSILTHFNTNLLFRCRRNVAWFLGT